MKTKNLYSIFKMAVIVFADIVMSFLACILSHLLFAGLHLELNQTNFIIFTLITVCLSIIFFSIFHLYSSVWRYAGEAELAKVGLATICITSVNVIIMFITRENGESYVPIRVGIVTGFILFLFTILVRFSFRLLRLIRSGHFRIIVTKAFYRGKEKVMIVGAGDAGVALLKELENPALNKMYAVCAIDDDVDKIGKRVLNVKVVGGRDKIVEAAKKYQVDKIIIAMPSVNPKEVSNIINICQETKCKILTVPGMYQYLNENVTLRSLRNVEIKDLLGREQIVVNLEEIPKGYDNNFGRQVQEYIIGERVIRIQPDAFWHSNKLKSFKVVSSNTIYCSIDGVLFNKDATLLIKYPQGAISKIFPHLTYPAVSTAV